jgi:hypothetical protein
MSCSVLKRAGIGRGTDPAERAFYRVFLDFNPLNVLGIG